MCFSNIVHFCLVYHPKLEDVYFDGLKVVGPHQAATTRWRLWVEQKCDEKQHTVSTGNFLIGKKSENGAGLNAKLALDERYFRCRTDVISSIPIFFLLKTILSIR